MQVAIVTGASSGLGKAIAAQLAPHYSVIDWSLEVGIDLTMVGNVQRAALAAGKMKPVLLVNCAGTNTLGPIDRLTEEDWDRVVDTNAKALWLTAKYMVPFMRGGTICNIISNASHVPMTHSLAYNASKGAAAIMTKTMARELLPSHGITVFGVSPNRLRDTPMSVAVDAQVVQLRGWTPEQTKREQATRLVVGVETPVPVVAEFIGYLLAEKERHRYLHGCVLEYGA